jgi:NAD-dependent SIR2 family protein deacetylase
MDLMTTGTMPLCDSCQAVLKPNVVLFGEAIRGAYEIQALVDGCDLLVVVGTSAVVYPAAAIPHMVRQAGGRLLIFDTAPTVLTLGFPHEDDFLFLGQAGRTVSAFADAALAPP